MESDASDDAFNISSGRGTTVLELCKMIMKTMKSKTGIEYLPEDASFLVTKRIGSTDKSFELLGFKAEIGISEGIARTIEWKAKL